MRARGRLIPAAHDLKLRPHAPVIGIVRAQFGAHHPRARGRHAARQPPRVGAHMREQIIEKSRTPYRDQRKVFTLEQVGTGGIAPGFDAGQRAHRGRHGERVDDQRRERFAEIRSIAAQAYRNAAAGRARGSRGGRNRPVGVSRREHGIRAGEIVQPRQQRVPESIQCARSMGNELRSGG